MKAFFIERGAAVLWVVKYMIEKRKNIVYVASSKIGYPQYLNETGAVHQRS